MDVGDPGMRENLEGFCVGRLKDQEEKGYNRTGFSQEGLLSDWLSWGNGVKDDVRSQAQVMRIMVTGRGSALIWE